MTRPNGAPILLPGHEAAARQAEIASSALRLQIAAGIVGQLLPQQLSMHRMRALLDNGHPTDSPVAVQFDAAKAIDSATSLAVAATDALLAKLGLQG